MFKWPARTVAWLGATRRKSPPIDTDTDAARVDPVAAGKAAHAEMVANHTRLRELHDTYTEQVDEVLTLIKEMITSTPRGGTVPEPTPELTAAHARSSETFREMNVLFDRNRELRTRVGPYLEEICRDDDIADVVASAAAAMRRELQREESTGEVTPVGHSLRVQEHVVGAVARAAQRD